MKTRLLSGVAVILMTCSMSAYADRDRHEMHGMMGMGPGMIMGPGMMMGPNMMMGPGMMGPGMMGPNLMGGYGHAWMLDLNESQQKKVQKIHDDLRKKQWDLMGKLNDEYVKLRDLYYSDKRDPKKIGLQQQRVDELRRKMLEASIEAQNSMEALLTPDQKKKMQDYRRGGMMW